MTEDLVRLVRLDRPTNRYTELELHFAIARAVDRADPVAWLTAVDRLWRRYGGADPFPNPLRVPATFFDILCRRLEQDLKSAFPEREPSFGELSTHDVPIVPVEE